MRNKKIPRFRSENEERNFWAREDSTEYIDWGKARRIGKGNKNMKRKISVRLPSALKRELKKAAAARKISMSQFANEAVASYLMKISNDPGLGKLLRKG